MRSPLLLAATLATLLVGCSSDDASVGDTVSPGSLVVPASDEDAAATARDVLVGQIVPAVEAVEAELGAPQRYFEVTANAQFVNVFVAVDDETAAVAYLFTDGELQPPAPKREGAAGKTFGADDIEFDESSVFEQVAEQLPSTSVNAFSVYGDGVGATYVIGGRSAAGGLLDIVVQADGQVVSVDPVGLDL